MNTIKRISASITAQINGMIDQIENHEAVANVALNDIRESLMTAKFQIRRVQNEQRTFQQRIDELRRDEEKWQERALHFRDKDQERALECMRRLKRNREESVNLLKQLNEHAALERQLHKDVRGIEIKFEDLKHKRSTLVARESRSQALQTVAAQHGATNVGGVFDRWEQKVMKGEVHGEMLSEPVDEFAAQFDSEEEKQELEKMLNDLK